MDIACAEYFAAYTYIWSSVRTTEIHRGGLKQVCSCEYMKQFILESFINYNVFETNTCKPTFAPPYMQLLMVHYILSHVGKRNLCQGEQGPAWRRPSVPRAPTVPQGRGLVPCWWRSPPLPAAVRPSRCSFVSPVPVRSPLLIWAEVAASPLGSS